jgi:hypothetical protein
MSNAKILEELAQDLDGSVKRAALHAEHAGCAFELRLSHGNSQLFQLSTQVPDISALRVTRPNAIDRLLGVRLPQLPMSTHDRRFDRAFVVQTRDTKVAAEVLSDEVRPAVRALFDTLTGLRLERGRLLAVGDRNALGKRPTTKDLRAMVEQLAVVARRIETVNARHTGPVHGRLGGTAITLVVLLSTAGLAGLIGSVVGYTRVAPIQQGLVAFWGLGAGAALLPVVFAGMAFLMRKRAAPQRQFAGLVLASLFALPAFTHGTLMWANALFDSGPQTTHTDLLADKTQNTDKNGNVQHFFWVEPEWATGYLMKFRTSATDWKRAEVGRSRMRVVSSPGRFGFEWIVSQQLMAE